jgi:myo-inositol-1(or 4)-monophosphatase
MKQTQEFLQQAKNVVFGVFQEVRPTLLEDFGKVEFSIKDDKTVVTELDRYVEKRLREELRKFAPEIGIVGEEMNDEGDSDTYWLVDPIDGTESFIRGYPTPRNMIALIENGEPQWCLVYKFVTDELFEATKGSGSTRNGQPINTSQRSLGRAWVEVGLDLTDLKVYECFREMRPKIGGIMVTRDFSLVASGELDGFVFGLSGLGGPWDYAPRALLLSEAGNIVTNMGSDKYDLSGKGIIAGNPNVHPELNKIFGRLAQ